ncbi:MAG: hypothetical protein IT318_06335 [Anaerolineales bacterium]|nr:hypothetical protein [Anaerolineales bacterium]
MPATSLDAIIRVRQAGVRSINLEHDQRDLSVASGYVLTAQAIACLRRIIDGLSSQQSVRAWTLTGPYGSGKSYFGLFLTNLSAGHDLAHQGAMAQLETVDKGLARAVRQACGLVDTQGLLPVPITGYRAALHECIRTGMERVLRPHRHVSGVPPLLRAIKAARDSRQVVDAIRSLSELLPGLGYRGAILVFDELGKSLEHAAAHSGEADIYLLQELAEFANRSGSTPFVFIGILHQAFERYASFLDSALQREWAKVQGRFEDVAFQEPPNQQMRLLAQALEVSHAKALAPHRDAIQREISAVVAKGWCPPSLTLEDFGQLCERAYPLHPSVLAALPYVFRRLAQNERSIFAYLASHEPFGFQEFLRQAAPPAFLRLPQVFDYLMANFQGRLYASGRARALTEAWERLGTTQDLSAVDTDLLKTIGLLNWLGELSHLKASAEAVCSALAAPDRPEAQLREASEALQRRSLVVHRRYNDALVVWQGSDVDVEARLDQARRQLGGSFSLAEAVQRYLPPRPLVARRHSYETGTLRYFEVRYVDVHNLERVSLAPSRGASGVALVALPANSSEAEVLYAWAKAPPVSEAQQVLVGVAEQTGRLVEMLAELRGLHWVEENTPELRDDPIARRELRARLAGIESVIQQELEQAVSWHGLGQGRGARWLHRGRPNDLTDGQSVGHLLSEICEKLYPLSPRLWNELINRRALSSQAAAARRNLIEAMLTRPNQPLLGIEGFPPERSMYASVLEASGLHREMQPGKWDLTPPEAKRGRGMLPVWEALERFVFDPPTEPRSVQTLFEQLNAPPYGLTDGVLPVILCAFLQVHEHEATLYREGTLSPEPGIADWEVLLRRPELFSVAGCRITGRRLVVLERLAKGFQVPAAVMPAVRELVRRLKALPEYAWRTQQVSTAAQQVRRVVDMARSPERLLFHDLPEAVGVQPFDEAESNRKQVAEFFDKLNAVLQELSEATPRLRDRARDVLLESFGLPVGEAGWETFVAMAGEMASRVTHPQLLPLLRRAADAADPRMGLESALAYIANRPVRSWADADAERFGPQAQALGRVFVAERDGVAVLASLTPAQERESRQVTDRLRRYLADETTDDVLVVRAALERLLRELSNGHQ